MNEPVSKQKKNSPLHRQVERGECKLLQERHPMEASITKNNRVTKETPQQCIQISEGKFFCLNKIMNSGQHTPFKDIFIDKSEKSFFFAKIFLETPQNLQLRLSKGLICQLRGLRPPKTSCTSHLD